MELEKLIKSEPRVSMAYHYEGEQKWPKFDKDSFSHRWVVTLKCDKRRMRVSYYSIDGKTNPTLTEVIKSLCSDSKAGEMSFEEFCHEFGLDPENPSAEKTWKACVDYNNRLKRLLDDKYELIMKAEKQ